MVMITKFIGSYKSMALDKDEEKKVYNFMLALLKSNDSKLGPFINWVRNGLPTDPYQIL